MATLNYTGDGGTRPPNVYSQPNSNIKDAFFYRRLKVADIIAADTDMTSNGYITANDIIQAIDVPAGFLFEGCAVRIITPCTANVNIEVGDNGGAEALASMDVDAAAGTTKVTIQTDAWADAEKFFTAADTIDVQFITANCLVGELELFVWGKLFTLGEAS